jgi:hypothetical protein
MLKKTEALTPIGTANDGTQIWKLTHNGVDTHFIHFHMFDVQVINRVGWDGTVKPPDDNEIGWKDTVRMNPLEDILFAVRPVVPTLPWDIPNSVRPLDPVTPLNTSMNFTNVDPSNQPAPVTNALVNFGWEYVWHCHILGHEENDMMRPYSLAVEPKDPTNLTAVLATPGSRNVTLTWKDNSINETGFLVQRASAANGPWVTIFTAPVANGSGSSPTYVDKTVAANTTYFYRVIATNVVGYTQTYAAPAIGYPTVTANSQPTAVVSILTNGNPVGFLMANSFEVGLAGWAGAIGNVQAAAVAVMGVDGGAAGLAANLAPAPALGNAPTNASQAAYVYDTTPAGEPTYEASFYFNPNDAANGDEALDIFTGLDQTGQPIFGVQYQREQVGDQTEYQIRGWTLINGEPVYSDWTQITNAAQKIGLAWKSGLGLGLSLFVNDALTGSLSGDTSANTLYEVLVGPSNAPANSSGTLYFDQFTSTRLSLVTTRIYLPGLFK